MSCTVLAAPQIVGLELVNKVRYGLPCVSSTNNKCDGIKKEQPDENGFAYTYRVRVANKGAAPYKLVKLTASTTAAGASLVDDDVYREERSYPSLVKLSWMTRSRCGKTGDIRPTWTRLNGPSKGPRWCQATNHRSSLMLDLSSSVDDRTIRVGRKSPEVR